jgi:hypothetical protein
MTQPAVAIARARPIACWPLPPLRPKRAAYGGAGLRAGSGQRNPNHALMTATSAVDLSPTLFHLTYRYMICFSISAPFSWGTRGRSGYCSQGERLHSGRDPKGSQRGTVYNRVGAVKTDFHTHEPKRSQGRHAKAWRSSRTLDAVKARPHLSSTRQLPRHEQESFARPTKAHSLLDPAVDFGAPPTIYSVTFSRP